MTYLKSSLCKETFELADLFVKHAILTVTDSDSLKMHFFLTQTMQTAKLAHVLINVCKKVWLPTTCAWIIENSNRVIKDLSNDVFVSTRVSFRKQYHTRHNVYKILVRKKCGLRKILLESQEVLIGRKIYFPSLYSFHISI